MKKTVKVIIAITASIAALAAASCTKDDTIRYNNATMGNIVNGKFTSDQGNIFNVAEQTYPGKLDTMKRAFVICDILSEIPNTKNEYEVRLNYVTPVLTKDAIYTSSLTEDNKLENDPIILQSCWLSGGYLNIYLAVPIVSDSKIKHSLYFEYDDTEKTEGTYTFHIRHDAAGEEFNDTNDDKIMLSYAYASVPVASIIKENNANVMIKWLSHRISGNTIMLNESIEQKLEAKYTKDSFQQVPAEATASRAAFELR